VRLESQNIQTRDYAEEMKKQTQNFIPNYSTLKENWATQRVSTAQDWDGWLQRLSSTVLQESPSASLRACATLQHYNLGGSDTELFHSGFMSVWKACTTQNQTELATNLERALRHTSASVTVKQTLLSLHEYMERNGCLLPLSTSALAEAAVACHAFAKALRYKENEFLSNPDAANVEALIQIHGNLNRHSEAALGVLLHAKKNLNVRIDKTWHEELGQWEEAADGYRSSLLAYIIIYGRITLDSTPY